MKNNRSFLKYAFFIAAAIALIAVFFQIKNQEVNFCRSIFNGLAAGKYSIEKYIDWENFKAVDVDAGQTYNGLPNEKERLWYKKAFIQNFALGFRHTGAKPAAFGRWRIYGQDDEKIIIACDYLRYNKTLLFTLSKFGIRKLTGLQWKGAQ